MIKKVYSKIVICMFALSFALAANAETMQVMSLSEFSTENPSEFIEVELQNEVTLGCDTNLYPGYLVQAKVVNVVSPKRLKRNAKFSVIPVNYTDLDGKKHEFDAQYVGKYSPKFEIDKGSLAKNAALTVGDHFLKGLSLGYHAVEGVVKNEEGNRLKSGVVSVYENTPLSYANNGEEIEIKKYDLFSFKFKNKKADNADSDDSDDSDSEQQTETQE